MTARCPGYRLYNRNGKRGPLRKCGAIVAAGTICAECAEHDRQARQRERMDAERRTANVARLRTAVAPLFHEDDFIELLDATDENYLLDKLLDAIEIAVDDAGLGGANNYWLALRELVDG